MKRQFVLKTMPLQFKLFVVICVILGPTEPAVVVSTNVLYIYYIPIRPPKLMAYFFCVFDVCVWCHEKDSE
jgi:hypothetical protein